jgi:translation initiation factor IF-3
MEKPPVCRIMDYGKYKYERKKRQKQSAQAHTVTLKEIRIRPKTDTHDREIKVKHAKEFLEQGHKVQFTMLFRGRERFHRERAGDLFNAILEELDDTVKIERSPAMDGRRMTMVVSPVKPKTTGGGQSSKSSGKQNAKPSKSKDAKPASEPPVKAQTVDAATAPEAAPVEEQVAPVDQNTEQSVDSNAS